MIERNQILCYSTSFRLIGLQNVAACYALDDIGDFPSKIVRCAKTELVCQCHQTNFPIPAPPCKDSEGPKLTILHADIHSLTGLGTGDIYVSIKSKRRESPDGLPVSMYRVSRKEDSLMGRELRSDPLSDLVSSPPVEFAIVEFVRCDDALCSLQNSLGCDFGSVGSGTTIADLLRCRKLDI